MSERRLRVILNPYAGHPPDPRAVLAALRALEQRGWTVERRRTSGPASACALAARAAADGCEAVLVCGGDGTINEVVNGLAGTNTALAVLPAGTVNIWAREAHLSRRPHAAVLLVDEGERRRVDLGRAGERYFLLLSSTGADGVAVRDVSPAEKRRFGRYAYFARGAHALVRNGGTALRVESSAGAIEGRFVALVIGNTRLYAGILPVAEHARLDDGLLDLCAYRGTGWPSLLPHATRTLLRRHRGAASVEYVQSPWFRISSPAALPYQLDGEFAGETPYAVTAVPAALTVIVPRGLRSPLFGLGPHPPPPSV